jgi:general nucleoside transport system permease protein
MTWDIILSFLGSTIRLSTPLMFAVLGGLLSERSGVTNIVLEGKMLMGAFIGGVVAFETGSPWLAFVVAGLAGAVTGLVYAFSALTLRANQIVAGTAINMLAYGVPPFIAKILYDVTGSTPQLSLEQRFTQEPLWIAVGLLVVVTLWMRFTRSGLWLSFAGEHPKALAAAGLRPTLVRWWAVITAGFLAGLGGASLSIFLSSSYSRNMTAGRGFMALAALILGKWRPLPAAAACILLGAADAAQIRLQGVVLWGTEPVPVQFIQILPYIVTVFVLAGFVGQSRPPKALGTLE